VFAVTLLRATIVTSSAVTNDDYTYVELNISYVVKDQMLTVLSNAAIF
jgi:hypothetical protein